MNDSSLNSGKNLHSTVKDHKEYIIRIQSLFASQIHLLEVAICQLKIFVKLINTNLDRTIQRVCTFQVVLLNSHFTLRRSPLVVCIPIVIKQTVNNHHMISLPSN